MSEARQAFICDVCGGPIARNNQSGVCSKTAACRREVVVRWRAANPEAFARHQADRSAELRRRNAAKVTP